MQFFFKFIFLLFVLSSTTLQAAFEPKGVGIQYLAAGGTGRAGNVQAFAVFLNPAALSQIQDRSIHLFYKNYYEIESLNQIALEARFSPFGVPVGIGVSRYGNTIYQEADIRAGTAFRLLEALDLGISLNLYSVYLKNSGHSVTAGFTIAASWAVFETLSAAIVVENLNEPELGASKQKIPLQMAAGLSWQIMSDIEILIDLVKEQDFDFDLRGGLSYHLVPWFALHGGFRTLVPVYSTGFTTSVGAFRLGYAFEYHLKLNGSHSIGAGYAF